MKKAICLVLSAVLAVCGLTACRRERRTIDETKTQLYVFNYDGGFGSDWLDTAIDRFEERYADRSFEAGKTGVQVWLENNISMPMNSTVRGQNNSIYFLEEKNYYEGIADGTYRDITEWVREPLTEFGETESIEDKMKAYGNTFPDFYRTVDKENPDRDNKYYAIPFHEGFWGINYDVDLFEEYKLFMNKEYEAHKGDTGIDSNAAYWTDGTDKTRLSAGADGEYGTIDDGLPATYADFYNLMDRMDYCGVTPIHWSGVSKRYTTNMMYELWADYEGEEQMMLNYTLNGTAKDLVSSIDGGEPVIGEEVAITPQNAYELQKQAGKYYALTFAEQVVSNSKYYENVSETEKNRDAISTYLYSIINEKPIAMLIEGSYWQREGDAIFTEMASIDESYSKQSRRFGMMPFPKATEEKVGEEQTIAGGAGSFIAVNGANTAIVEKQMELAKLFIQYIHTDEILKVFTESTGATRPLEYEFTDEEMAALPYYTQTIWNFHKNNNIICPWANTNLVISNHDEFNDQNTGFKITTAEEHPFSYLKNMTAEDAFGRLYTYKRSRWENNHWN